MLSHLRVSHAVPVMVVSVALVLLLAALVRISMVLTAVNEEALVVLRDESALHRAAWILDVSLRHGQEACTSGAATGEVAAGIRAKLEELRALARGAAKGPLTDLVEDYVEVGEGALAGDPCSHLVELPAQRQRAKLDEWLTNAWVDRLEELHVEVTEQEEIARRMAVSASWLGIPLGVASLLLAMIVARRTASVVSRPLAHLAAAAERVGRGEFQTRVEVAGPSEVLALAGQLERMRAQLRRLESLKQGFLASVSHELRTPLTKIRESLALLEDGAVGPTEPRRQRVIQIARTACEHEIRLVSTLLDLSRLRAGSPLRPRTGVRLDPLLQRALHTESSLAQAQGITVTLVPHGDALVGRLDPELVECAFANLVRNAIAVSASGQCVVVERFIESSRKGERGCWARITVADQGPGVPVEIRDTVFEAFVTEAVPGSGKALGFGLGLALAREVAEAHGGELTLARSDATGSTFQMWLPMEATTARPDRQDAFL